ncbi:pyridoxal phosphate-dependent aminotransferase [Salsipaludibacter albus]|uniref:pyridoxal phosphate-dependent aminotransferase n=1 Tax=Salsipaludibacter albus TaxID=2849650 RepID=UPI001EE46BD6|nr:aminotransferase class I/II-fold pyridoxal phosphate-dependent enzyme [Salsipaludibacter albus]
MSLDSAAAVGPPVGMEVRLSSNEAPFGPSPRAVSAMTAAVPEAHRYCDDQATELRAAIAAHEDRDVEEIAVGTGSAALLMDAIGHECRDGGDVLTFERAFIVYRLAARNAGVDYVEVATGGPAVDDAGGYQRSVDALVGAIDEHTRLVVVDNPGNPTGAHLDADELTTLVEGTPRHVTLVIDEAYHQFAVGHRGYATVAELGLEHPRMLVMRTFSKAHALAGMRVGYVMGPRSLVGEVDAWRTRFNVAAPAQAAAVASLDDTEHLEATVRGTLAGREQVERGLADLGVPHTPSLGNFVTFEVDGPAAPVIDAFADQGVGVRGLLPYDMPSSIRVTVGTPDEIDRFLTAAATVLV